MSNIKHRLSEWPHLWGFFLGGAALPLLWLIDWHLFLMLFPKVRSDLQDDVIGGFLITSELLAQVWRGALLGWASELVFHAHLANSRAMRPIAICSGALGVGFFGPDLWANWNALPQLLRHYEESPQLSRAIQVAFSAAIPFLWSLALLFMGIHVRRK